MTSLRLCFAAVLWLAALSALAASVLAQGGRFSARLDVLSHFAPFYLAAAVAALLVGLIAWRTPGLLAATSLAVAAAAALMAPEFLAPPPPRAAGSPDQIKLIQFNAWGGGRPEALRWLLDEDPDVIVLEEGGKLSGELVAAGYHCACRGCDAAVFSRRAPIRTYSEPYGPSGSTYVSSASFRDARGEYTVIAVHRFWPVRFASARAQTAGLHAYIASLPKGRLILAGDFNATPWSFAVRREDRSLGLIRRTRALFSWPAARLSHNRLPAPFPYLPIDHVYAGSAWRTVSVRRGPALGSDHYPVIVTLAPAGAGAT